MNCTEFVSMVGLKEALEILGAQVWEKAELSFEQLEHQRRLFFQDKVFREKILEKMIKIAFTYDQWVRIWQIASEDKDAPDSATRMLVVEKIGALINASTDFDQVRGLRPRILSTDFDGQFKILNGIWLRRLMELANSVEQWYIVRVDAYNLKLSTSDLVAQAVAKMEQCATTVKDWEKCYHEAPKGSPAQKRALWGLAQLAKDHNAWATVWHRAEKTDNLARVAQLEVIASAKTFQEWSSILAFSKDDKVTRELCLKKLVGLAKTFEDWLGVYQSGEGQIKANALNQVFTKAETLEDWLKIWRWTPEGSRDKTFALMQIRGFVKLE